MIRFSSPLRLTAFYELIDELLGTESKFKELIDKAEKAGIRVMLDGVFNFHRKNRLL